MPTITYEIKLNESGRPYIELPQDYNNKPEDRFFALELARYIIQDSLSRTTPEFDPQSIKNMEIGLSMLGQIGDNVAQIIYNQMEYFGDLMFDMETNYHIGVETLEDLHNLSFGGIAYQDKIYKRQNGLKVFVDKENRVFELMDGFFI